LASCSPRREPWSGTAGRPGQHLLAALDHAAGVVLEQVDAEAKTNEIPVSATLPDRIDLAGAVVTADALCPRTARSWLCCWRRRCAGIGGGSG